MNHQNVSIVEQGIILVAETMPDIEAIYPISGTF
jgi:hypothetical protein